MPPLEDIAKLQRVDNLAVCSNEGWSAEVRAEWPVASDRYRDRSIHRLSLFLSLSERIDSIISRI